MGLNEAVKSVLEAKGEGKGFAGVVGVLAELVESWRDHAAEAEAALGSMLQALVVESMTTLPAVEDMAKLSGRVAFVALAGLDRPAPDSAVESTHAMPLERRSRWSARCGTSCVPARGWTRRSRRRSTGFSTVCSAGLSWSVTLMRR